MVYSVCEEVAMWLYGIHSQIPLSFCRGIRDFSIYGKHWILADIDCKKPSLFFDLDWFFIRHFGHGIDWYEITKHGLHIAVFEPLSFEEMVQFLPHIPYIDMKWFSFGVQRGGWFLVTYKPVFDNHFCYMRIRVKRDNEWLSIKFR